MVIPVLRRLHSPDVPDLTEFQPVDATNVGFLLLQMIVGPLEGEGEESFDVIVCIPRWLLENQAPDEVISGRHHIVMAEYNLKRLEEFITSYLCQCEGNMA
jgi:hypothetical protein